MKHTTTDRIALRLLPVTLDEKHPTRCGGANQH
jgi:hypothetical protein